MTSRVPAVGRQSVRVALVATALVALAYLLIAVAVIAFTTGNLTSQIDNRITGFADTLPPVVARPPGVPFEFDGIPRRPLGLRLLVWTIASDGSVLKADETPDLPAELTNVTTPLTATIEGEQIRIAGTDVGDERVVVGESLAFVAAAQRTIVLGTVLIAPILLTAVFIGAVAVGRRVATPIEAARRRQLEFTADASHELRTPLSVIEAEASLALAGVRDGASYRAAFNRVEGESRRMRQLLDDMLWLARFDSADTPRASEMVDLSTLVRQSADRFEAVAASRRLTLKVELPAETVGVRAPPELLDRLVGVLVDNACKFTPEGGTVLATVSVEDGRPSVSVEDSGPGIDEADGERIFDRFHRSLATSDSAPGAGLGLAIANAVVSATRGKWTVERSRLGGARFTVSWPPG